GRYTAEDEKALFERVNASDSEAMLVCLVDGKVAGNCQIAWKKSIKTRHRAAVAIALLREYWNLGIGTAMFRELIDTARKNGVEQLELEFVEGNERGKALYEKMGFVVVGEKPDAYRLKDGSSRKEISMIKRLDK
ncbi:MAG: GNAT family N-acetyltransferase, partial [Clostridia bacterium]|nr:GNAT family N-acetyltransferase [Clostridia bacterium]